MFLIPFVVLEQYHMMPMMLSLLTASNSYGFLALLLEGRRIGCNTFNIIVYYQAFSSLALGVEEE